MAIFDDLQYCNSSKRCLGGPKKVKNMKMVPKQAKNCNFIQHLREYFVQRKARLVLRIEAVLKKIG